METPEFFPVGYRRRRKVLGLNYLSHRGISISDAAAGEDMSLPEAASPSALKNSLSCLEIL